MLVKSIKASDHLTDLGETFSILQEYQMKLNLAKCAFGRSEVSGRLTKWAIELGEFDIQFRPKTAIKGQDVADFIAEFTTPSAGEVSTEGKTIPPEPPSNPGNVSKSGWILYAEKKAVNPVQATLSWMDPVFNYLTSGYIPSDKLEARRLRVRAARYVVLDGILYKKWHSQPYLKCLRPDEADYVIRKIHEGICGNHFGSRSLALKILRQGYFWPTIKEDSKNYVQKRDKCQRYAAAPRQYAEKMTPMSGLWPFTQWGIDIIGHLLTGKGQVKFAIVTVDYFTKQFDNDKFRGKCRELGIINAYSSPRHPQSNGQVEAVNKVIKHHLKTKLEKAKGNWAEELPFVLWAYKTIA
ncbi:uncharacterized protein LOC131224130 [Magnolia sinica]|uniref:uncharacterized protein LOC131224130 n=1 Tax=Magnolia sinica TaxID=86752 RepID=UPI0026584318|nr:uncharacterized protein LOC131224130 [Magnolia sinica]